MLNGLDLAGKTFLINLFTLAVRICGVLFLIPQFGILGYLWALLASQLRSEEHTSELQSPC